MRRRLILPFLISGLAVAGFLAVPPAARADGTSCVGVLDDRRIDGDLVVPPQKNCALHNVTVTGNVRVGRDAGLRVADGTTIRGSIEADHCQYASFEPLASDGRISIEGDVEIRRCRQTSGKLFTAGIVRISGNFVCRDNAAPCFAVALRIYGDAAIDRNAGGMSYVEGNTISGKLACRGNIGVTNYGDPNRVTGDKLGQCAGL